MMGWEGKDGIGRLSEVCGHVCCQKRDLRNVKSITAQAELFDNISHDCADTRFPGVYSVFPEHAKRSVEELSICWRAADWEAEYSRDKLLTWEHSQG